MSRGRVAAAVGAAAIALVVFVGLWPRPEASSTRPAPTQDPTTAPQPASEAGQETEAEPGAEAEAEAAPDDTASSPKPEEGILATTVGLVSQCRATGLWALELPKLAAETALHRQDLSPDERSSLEAMRVGFTMDPVGTWIMDTCHWLGPAEPPQELLDSWTGRDVLTDEVDSDDVSP